MASDKQQTPTTGITEDKQTLRDANLGAQVEMSKSSLDKMDDSTWNKQRSGWSGLANDHVAALADFDVVAADVTALEAARAAFAGKKTSPRMATGDRKTQTESYLR